MRLATKTLAAGSMMMVSLPSPQRIDVDALRECTPFPTATTAVEHNATFVESVEIHNGRNGRAAAGSVGSPIRARAGAPGGSTDPQPPYCTGNRMVWRLVMMTYLHFFPRMVDAYYIPPFPKIPSPGIKKRHLPSFPITKGGVINPTNLIMAKSFFEFAEREFKKALEEAHIDPCWIDNEPTLRYCLELGNATIAFYRGMQYVVSREIAREKRRIMLS
jgi:hypothetical protein